MAQKKVIVPVVALLLSLTALAGVGLAYTGTYTDSIENDVSTDSLYVKVDVPTQISFGENAIELKFDTAQIRGEDREYTFNLTENPVDEEAGDEISETTYTRVFTLGTFTVTAGEAAASGTIAVVSDVNIEGAVGISSITVESSETGFTLGPNASDTYTLTATVIFTTEGIDDGTVNNIVIPAFNVTITAETTATEPSA